MGNSWMEIPQALLQQIIQGNAVLFPGAGASSGAVNLDGQNPPSGEQLADLIAKKFLGPEQATARHLLTYKATSNYVTQSVLKATRPRRPELLTKNSVRWEDTGSLAAALQVR